MEGGIQHGDSVFQLIPKVAGPEAELRVGWGQDHRQLDIVSDPENAQKGSLILWVESVDHTTGQEERGSMTYFIFTKELLFFSWI